MFYNRQPLYQKPDIHTDSLPLSDIYSLMLQLLQIPIIINSNTAKTLTHRFMINSYNFSIFNVEPNQVTLRTKQQYII